MEAEIGKAQDGDHGHDDELFMAGEVAVEEDEAAQYGAIISNFGCDEIDCWI